MHHQPLNIMIKKIVPVFFLLVCFSSFSIEYSLKNPRATVETHLSFLADNENDTLSANTLYAPEKSLNERLKLAKKLKQVYDGSGHYILTHLIPEDSNYTNPQSGNHIYIPDTSFKALYVQKIGNKWYYSKASVNEIDRIHKKVYPFGTHRLVNLFTHQSTYKLFGLDLWQFFGIFSLAIIGALLYGVSLLFFQIIIHRIANKISKSEVEISYIKPIIKPIAFLMVFIFLTLFIPVLQLPISIGRFLIISSNAAIPLFLMIFAYKMVDVFSLYFERLAEKSESKLDDQLVPLVKKALKVFVVIIGTLFVLQNLSFNVTALLAGVSISGIALAFAAQDTLKNFFGSIMIFLDRPFQIGDWIIATGIDGSVEEVGFRSTRVRTFANSVVSVPNGKLADSTIDNMGERRIRRYKTSLALTYDTPPHLVEGFIAGLRKIVLEHPVTVKDNFHVYFTGLGASSLDILFYIFFNVPDWGAELNAKHQINLSIIKLADDLGVRFAFNTQTIHIEDFPEKESLTPQEYTEEQDLKNKIAAFKGYPK